MHRDHRDLQPDLRAGPRGKLTALARALFERAAPPVDPEAKAAELRGLGFTAEQVAAHLAHLAQRSQTQGTFELWECHAPALEVFTRCQWTAAAGATQVVWLGVGTPEIRAVAEVLGIPCTAELLDDVQTMTAAAAAVRNRAK